MKHPVLRVHALTNSSISVQSASHFSRIKKQNSQKMMFESILLIFATFAATATANDDAKRLFDDLMNNYNHFRRPGKHDEVLTINLKMRLSQIIDVHEKTQIMTTSIWLKQQWYDQKLSWNPEAYGNTTVIYMPSSYIWVPDIVLYNNADGNYNITIQTKATLWWNGRVEWEPAAVFKSLCTIDVRWFPFDEQLCHMKFGSWTYSEDLLDLRHLEGFVEYELDPDENGIPQNTTVVTDGIDLSDYYPSVEWAIIANPAKRHGKTYPSCCPGSPAYIDITYYLHLRRKPLFYTVNLVFPCCGISFLTILVFYLPARSCSKINLCISILVSLTVFFLLLMEIIPATSIALPLIAKYLLFTMGMVTLSVMSTVVTINVHYRTPSTHRMPNWIKKVFLDVLPRFLRMSRPLICRKSLRQISIESIRSRAQSAASRALWRRIGVLVSSETHLKLAGLQTDVNGPAGADVCPLVSDCPHQSHIATRRALELRDAMRSPVVTKSIDNVCFISELLKDRDRQDKIDEDWKFASMVLDRLLLWIFSVSCFVGTVTILLQAPSLRDDRPAIDDRMRHSQNTVLL